MPNKRPQQARENAIKYLKPPSIEQIASFLKEIGITRRRFENYHNLPRGTLTHVWMGRIDLPKSYWHIIYEKIVPTYGEGYTQMSRVKTSKKRVSQKKIKKENHSRLENIE